MSTSVDGLIADARAYAQTQNAAAVALVQAAESAISSIGTDFNIIGPADQSTQQVNLSVTLPEFVNPSFDAGTAPVAPTNVVPLPVLTVGTAPVNTAVKPTLQEPAIPAPIRQFGLTAPTLNTNFNFPSVPAELQSINIQAPTILDKTLPLAPNVQLPVFGTLAPVQDLTPPSDLGNQFASAYRGIAPTMTAALDAEMDTFMTRYNPNYQAQLSALEAQITKYMNGGTGLNPNVESAIYERSRSKTDAEFKRVRDTAYTDAAKRGFSLPPGAVFSAVQQARQGGADANARAAIEIAISQAELEQKNVQFAVTTSAQLRTAVMSASISYHSNLVQINGQALDYAKSILSAAIEVYNTLVRGFEARLDAYKADVQVYEVRMRAATVAIEIYKAQIAGVEAQVRVDLAKVDIYKARLEALNVLANVYRSQIDAVVSQANIEKVKIELFGAQVQAYGVEAQAKAAEYQGYTALVNGQEARLKAYGEEVRAYVANVEGYRATVQAKSAEVEAIATVNRSILGQYTAQVEGYRALVGAKAQIASTTIDFQKTKLQAFSAQVGAQEAQARLAQEYFRTKATLAIENTKVVLQAAVESAKLKTVQIESVAKTALEGARVYGGIASAALSGINTLVTSSTSS